jgi:hypothetical protein
MNAQLSPYARVHKKATSAIDAYEQAWDFAATIFWQLLGYNTLWFLGFIIGWVSLRVFTLTMGFGWTMVIILNLVYLLTFLPIWELANIMRFQLNASASMNDVINLAIGRVIYSLVLMCGYACFILPGIYLHCRLLLHMPIFARSPNTLGIAAMRESWHLTKGRFVALYALWIVTVLSKPVCALPLGLGFILERPLSGFAKEFLLLSYSAKGQQ